MDAILRRLLQGLWVLVFGDGAHDVPLKILLDGVGHKMFLWGLGSREAGPLVRNPDTYFFRGS